MVTKVFVALLLFAAFQSIAAQCDKSFPLPAEITLTHSATVGSCRYKYTSAVDTFIQAKCTLSLQDTTCNNQRFAYSRSGELTGNDDRFLCSSGTYTFSSIGNELVVWLATSGSFQCVLTPTLPNNLNCDCGWTAQTRIVGGSPTVVNEYVSHVGLVDKNTKQVFCGGIIIRQNWFITAAHCFDAFPNTATTMVLAGDHNLDLGTDTPWTQGYLLSRYIKHWGYNSDTHMNDIALGLTTTPIRYTLGVGPACLPYTFNNADSYFIGKSLMAVGWGMTSFAGKVSRILLKAPLTVITNTDCSTRMKSTIDNSKVCADGFKVRDTCSQDSGGGLYWNAARNYPIGLVSYGEACGSDKPSVNTRITFYIGWIESTVGGFFCRKT